MVDGYRKMNPVDRDWLKDHYKKDTVDREKPREIKLPKLDWVLWAWEELTNEGIKTRDGKDGFISLCKKLGYKASSIREVIDIPERPVKSNLGTPDQVSAYETIETLINKNR